MKKNLEIVFFLLIHFIRVHSELEDLYQLNLSHQHAIDQLDQQVKINGLHSKFGIKADINTRQILDVVIRIQEGNIPENIRVLNTTYNTQEINGRNLTVYDTTYEQGNEEEGTKNRVRIILDPYTRTEGNQSMTDWWIDSSNWKGYIRISRLTYYRLWGNGKKYKIVKRSSVNSIKFKRSHKKIVL